MQGSIDKTGTVKLTWNTQEDKLTSPDGKMQLLPCEECGKPQWVALNVVSTICEACYGFPLQSGLYEVLLDDGNKRNAWFIERKTVWVTPDGSQVIDGVVSWKPLNRTEHEPMCMARAFNAGYEYECTCTVEHPDTDLHRSGCVSCQTYYDSKLPNHGEQGSALTPVIAILTAFTVTAVLIAQSGLLRLVLARLAEVR